MKEPKSVKSLVAMGVIDASSMIELSMEFPSGVGAEALGGMLTSTSKMIKACAEEADETALVEVFVVELNLTERGFTCKLAVVPVAHRKDLPMELQSESAG